VSSILDFRDLSGIRLDGHLMRFSALPVLTNFSSLRSGSRSPHQLTRTDEFSKRLMALLELVCVATP
jgi:hypothetical protein